jgi:hypothetical protein
MYHMTMMDLGAPLRPIFLSGKPSHPSEAHKLKSGQLSPDWFASRAIRQSEAHSCSLASAAGGSVFPWPTDQASLSPASEAGRDTRLKPTVQVPLSKPCPSGRSGPYSPRPAIQASLGSASVVGRAVRLTLLGPASVTGRDTYPKPTVQVSLSKPCLSGGPGPYSPRPAIRSSLA